LPRWQGFPNTISHGLSGNRLECRLTDICCSDVSNTLSSCSVTLNFRCLKSPSLSGFPTRATSLGISADLLVCPQVLPAGRNDKSDWRNPEKTSLESLDDWPLRASYSIPRSRSKNVPVKADSFKTALPS
jgi:hypothetical protein